jgi:hypothetical protein
VRIRRFNIAAILLMTAILVSNVVADPYIRDVGSIDVAETYQEYLESNNHALRYRLVTIKSESLQATLVELAESGNTNRLATIELRLFDDVLLIANVLSYRYGRFNFFVKAGHSNCKSRVDGDGSNGSLEMTKLGHVTGRFWVCDQTYTIGPTRDLRLPYHVVWQLDPNNLPSID